MSQFFACLEDEVILKFASEDHRFTLADDPDYESTFKSMSNRRYQHIFDGAQTASNSSGKTVRKNAVAFDENLRIQREIVYKAPRQLQTGGEGQKIDIAGYIRKVIADFLTKNPQPTWNQLTRFVFDNLSYDLPEGWQTGQKFASTMQLTEALLELFEKNLAAKKASVPAKSFHDFVLKCALKSIDENWIEEVDYLSQYKQVVKMTHQPKEMRSLNTRPKRSRLTSRCNCASNNP